jgi:PBSX family phage portal protein
MADAQEEPKEPRATLKARLLGQAVHAPVSIREDTDQLQSIFREAGVLEPPYNPIDLLRMWENSSALPQNVQAYVTNIDGLGYRFAARFDLFGEEAEEKVRDAMWVERVRAAEASTAASDDLRDAADDADVLAQASRVKDPEQYLPTDEVVAKTVEALRIRARFEKARLDSFFEGVYPDGSFETLRRHTRQDLEIVGNGFWEILRNRVGEVSRFVGVPPTHVRCTALDEIPVMVPDRVHLGLGWEVIYQPKFFRRYVQAVGSKIIWFKQFGDPRVVSRETGRIYANLAVFAEQTRGREHQATEMVHFRIHRTGEPYGVPRWIGNLLAVLGSRASDEVNFAYFDNKAIPPLALLVSGGRLSSESVTRIETFIRDHIKGRENFHKIMVIEADDEGDPMSPHEHPRLTFERLGDVQKGDAMFQKYDERNVDKIGSSFRLPRLLRGDVRDFNKSTADASLRFADEQVFEPERKEFDSWLNRVILPMLDIRMWTFRSLGPQTRDPERVAAVILDLAKVGAITPNEARYLSSDILGHELDPLDLPWAKQPIQLTLAGFAPPVEGAPEDMPPAVAGLDVAEAQDLVNLSHQGLALGRRRTHTEGDSALAALDAAAARAASNPLGHEEDADDSSHEA